MRKLLVAVTAVLLAGCGVTPSPSPATSVALPTLTTFTGACRGVGLDATLTGDPMDPRVTWLLDEGGRRQDIVWPPGFTARFTPELEVLDASGAIVFSDGDEIDGGCTAGGADDPGAILLIPQRS